MPNPLAMLMLLIWPVVTVAIFKRMSMQRALIWSLLIGYLILPPAPAAFDFPLLPPFNKETIPNISVFVVCATIIGAGVWSFPSSVLGKILIIMFAVGPFLTALTNSEPIFFQSENPLPGLKFTDGLALSINQLILLFPYFLARQIMTKEDGLKDLLVALLIAGVGYSFLMLIEVRLSPQLNLWIYGYFQHSFAQAVRFGGFRPVVFLEHGLWVAFFAMTAFIAAISLWKSETGQNRPIYLLATGYMGVILFLTKSLGSLLYGAFLLPLVVILGPKLQIKIAMILSVISMAYPILKGVDLMPTKLLLEQAERVSEERAGSLKFRFVNEDILLDRANLKPVFGWGSWGRNHEHNPVTGVIMTVTDGQWIIAFGTFGWVGFLAEFGLLALPIFMLWRMLPYVPKKELSRAAGALSLLLAVNMVDLLPNATLTPLTWLLAGALLGYAEGLRSKLHLFQRDGLKWKPLM